MSAPSAMRLKQLMEAAADAQPEQKRARDSDADDADGAVDAVFTDDAQEPVDFFADNHDIAGAVLLRVHGLRRDQ